MEDCRKHVRFELEDDIGMKGQIYQPLASIFNNQIRKSSNSKTSRSGSGSYSSSEMNILEPPETINQQILQENGLDQQLQGDHILGQILMNTRASQNIQVQQDDNPENFIMAPEAFSFNQSTFMFFPETPRYQMALQSPFCKFNHKYQLEISNLLSFKICKDKIECLEPSQNPLQFVDRPALFFLGIASKLKKSQDLLSCRFFYHLSCFVEPYNPKVWEEYVSLEKNVGNFHRAFVLLKTAFLFKRHSNFAIDYLQTGDKCKASMHQLRGILRSLKDPSNFQKVIIESSRFQLKNRKTSRGLILLHKLCTLGQFRPNLSHGIIMLAREFQAMGKIQKAKQILQTSISNNLSKYQGHSLYLEIIIRLSVKLNMQDLNNQAGYSFLINSLKYICQNRNLLTTETRYKFCLELAETVSKFGGEFENLWEIYNQLIQDACFYAYEHCRKGSGLDRAMRQIFFTVLYCSDMPPPMFVLKVFPHDNQLKYQENRWLFINGFEMKQHDFTDWKYYLHFALEKNDEVLRKAEKKWPQSGRLIVEWVHALRAKKGNNLAILKLWRQKIQAIPKSGELWCEGGRIYSALRQFRNASKCFEFALHFTPQYGDTFFQILKLHLIQNRFYQIQRLKKNFIISDPFYGNVLSFLSQENHKINNTSYKLSQAQIWEKAMTEIKMGLYSHCNQHHKVLTACPTYNTAYLFPLEKSTRQRLFSSYEQLDSKSYKI